MDPFVMERERVPPSEFWWRVGQERAMRRRNRGFRIWGYSGKTVLEFFLVGVYAIILTAVLVMLAVLVAHIQNVREDPRNPRSNCVSDICIQQANALIDSMNTTIYPCNDFYEYACGSYFKEIPVPRYGKSIEPTDTIDDLVYFQLRYELEQPSLPTDIEAYVMLREMYASCMDTSAIENSGLDQMKLLLKKLGGWPMLQGDQWVEFDWIDVTERLRQNGFDTNQFLEIDLLLNDKLEYFIAIDQRYNMSHKFDVEYDYFALDLAKLFGVPEWSIKHDIEDLRHFRDSLSKFVVKPSQPYNMITIGELEAKYPSIPWLRVINVALAIPNVILTKQDRVGVRSFEYISEFVKTITHTPKHVQVNHALIDIIRSRINFLPSEIQKMEREFYFGGVAQKRSTTCLLTVIEHFHIAMDAMYIRTYGNETDKEVVTEIMSNIKSMFILGLKKMTSMDEETKAVAVEKVKVMRAHIAYPDGLQNENNVKKFYEGLTLDSQYILEQVNRLSKFNRDKMMKHYRKPTLRRSWDSPLQSFVNRKYYNERENSFYIPLSIMQHEYYDLGRPTSMNYAGIGYWIATELANSFVSTGVNEYVFNAKNKCFIEKYNKYNLTGTSLHMNAHSTLVKNVADNFSVKVSYLTYLHLIETANRQPRLPGLNLNHKQLFWLPLANTRCSKYNEEYNPYDNPLAPNRYRVLGPLSNLEEFAKDFSCSLGSNMNTIKKCKLW